MFQSTLSLNEVYVHRYMHGIIAQLTVQVKVDVKGVWMDSNLLEIT